MTIDDPSSEREESDPVQAVIDSMPVDQASEIVALRRAVRTVVEQRDRWHARYDDAMDQLYRARARS